MPWALSDLRTKVRQVTGRLDTNQLSNNELDRYINNYYQYTFPAEVKLEREHTFYTFNTIPAQQQYDFTDTTFTNIQPILTVDGFQIDWYQDPNVYFNSNPIQISRFTVGSGDGATVTFSTTIGPPILAGTTIVTDNVETFTDDSNGVLTGDLGGTGTVDYLTGAVSVTFATAPASGDNVLLSWEGYRSARPTSVLFYNNVFRFDPIPDTVYRIQLQGYRVESALANATDTPRLQEWGPTIAYGASRDILADKGEYDKYMSVTALYKEQLDYILSRTVQNLMNTRASPRF